MFAYVNVCVSYFWYISHAYVDLTGNVDLDLAGQLYADLCVARENLAVNSHLHLLYLVTPYQPLASTSLVPDVLYAAVRTHKIREQLRLMSWVLNNFIIGSLTPFGTIPSLLKYEILENI